MALMGCPGGSAILWHDLEAPRDAPAPDLQVALRPPDARAPADVMDVTDAGAPFDATTDLGDAR